MATSEMHHQLVKLGAAWLRRNGFGVVDTERRFAGMGEQPDVIGFRSSSSCIIEAKATRSDFLADAKKPWRSGSPALGVYRFYICPEGLISTEELPKRWGLLYESKGRVQQVVGPTGNYWPGWGDNRSSNSFYEYQHEPHLDGERRALYSIARRLCK